MTAHECSCSRPVADGATLCRRCTTKLRRELRAVPELVEDLHITLTRQDQLTAKTVGRAAETPVLWKDTASKALTELRFYLTSWVRCIADDTGLAAGHVRDTSPACAVWLLRHHRVVRLHPAAGDLLDELQGATEHARDAIDLPPDSSRFRVGPCPEPTGTGGGYCPGEVWAHIPTARDERAMLRCRACETEWDTTRWYRTGARINRRRAEIARAEATKVEEHHRR